MLYELNPGYVSEDGLTRHNPYGFRGPAFEPAKPPGRWRIVCIGESTTYCTGIADDAATYPARLEAHLRRLLPEVDLEVLNAGVGGYTSAENILNFVFKVQPVNPDLMIYYFTHNDVHPRRFPRLSRDYREYSRSWYEPRRRGWRWRPFKTDRSIGDRVRRYDEYEGQRQAFHVLDNPPAIFRDNMTALTILARGFGIRQLLINPPYRDLDRDYTQEQDFNLVYRAVCEHRQVIEEIGRRFDIPVLDLWQKMPYPPYRAGEPWHSDLHLDSVHVNERGADLMGRLVAEAIVAYGLAPLRREA
jgi:lysophospholipase L1-like esterase